MLGRQNTFWLLAMRGSGKLEVLTTTLGDGRGVLPVFSFEEEANLYLRHGIPGGWRVRRTQTGELVSLLYGLCSKVELVALDLVSDAEADVVNWLVSMERKRFVNFLLHREASVRGALSMPSARSSESQRDGFPKFITVESPTSLISARSARSPKDRPAYGTRD